MIGTASKEVNLTTPCPTCPTGRAPEGEENTACSPCQAGKYEDETGACSECPNGWAQPDQTKTKCLQCGTESSPNFKTANVIKGETTDKTGSASCSLCDVGTYGPLAKPGKCEKCPIGQYEDGKGGVEDALSTCKLCPIDTYSNEEGKSSIADCTACPKKTTTNEIKGRTEESACVCQTSFYGIYNTSSATLTCVACIKEQTNCR